MARNLERDAQRAEERRNKLMTAGFRLFSTQGFENVSLQLVADEAKVAPATMYNYFHNKENLIIAINAKMCGELVEAFEKKNGKDLINSKNAYELIQLYNAFILDLFQNRSDILSFSGCYKTFITRSETKAEDLEEQMSILSPINKLFHEKYEEAKVDGSIRTDISEQELLTTLAWTMLGMAERFTLGVVWAKNESSNYVKEMEHVSEMILNWVKGPGRK